MKFVKYAIGGTVGLVFIALLAIVVIVNFIDPNLFKGTIEERVAAQTGRKLTIDGDIQWGFWPNIRLRTGSIQLSNAPGFGDQPFLKLDEFEFAVETWPLISRSIRMDVVKLHGAKINLTKNANGVANWDDLVKEKSDQADEPVRGEGIPDIAIGGVDIQNASFSFRDDTTQQAFEFSAINMKTGPLEFGDPVDLKATLNMKSTKPDIAGNTSFSARLVYDLDNERYIIEPMVLAANLKGSKIPGGATKLKLSSIIDANLGEQTLTIRGLKFTGLDTTLMGALAISDLDHDKPSARGTLKLDGKDIATLFRIFESPIADQLTQAADRTFNFNMNFNTDMRAGNVIVPKLKANLLGARIVGQFVANNADTEKPKIAGRMSAVGPDLPALVALAGQLKRDNSLREIGQKLSKSPGKAFSFKTAFKADLQSGEVAVSALKGEGLGLALDGVFKANDINAEKGPIAGKLSLTGKGLKPLLAAVGQEDLGDIVQLISANVGLSGTIANLSFKPLTISTLLDGKDIPNGPVELKLEADTTNANLEAETVTVEDLSISGLGLNLVGNLNAVKIKSTPSINGNLSIKPFNLRTFMTQLKQVPPAMADTKTLTKLGLNTDFTGSMNNVELNKLSVILDQTTLNGSFAVTDFAKQDITFDLNIDKIDVDRYLPPTLENPKDQNKDKKKTPTTPKTTATNVGKLPVELLQNLKLKGAISVGELKISNATMQKATASIQAGNGDIQINPIKMNLYEGKYQGAIRLDVKNNILAADLGMNLTDIKLRPFLQDIADNDFLGGTANIEMALTGAGPTSDAILQSLNGQTKLNVSKGTIRGLTALSKLGQRIGSAGSLVSGDLTGAVKSAMTNNDKANELYFSGLSATAIATNGMFTNDDLKLEAPLLRASGVGTLIDFNTNTMDYTSKITFVATLEGSGGKSLEELTGLPRPMLEQLKGIPIAMRRHGPIDQAETDIDWDTLIEAMPKGSLKDAFKTGSTLEKLHEDPGKVIKEKIFDKFLRKNNAEESVTKAIPGDTVETLKEVPDMKSETTKDKVKESAKDLLRGLFE